MHVFSLVKYFKKHYDIIFICGEKSDLYYEIQKLGVMVYSIPTLTSSFNFTKLLKSFFSLKSIIEFENPDFIHCHSAASGLVSRILGLLLKIPTIYTVHGFGFGKGRHLIIAIPSYVIEFFLARITFLYITVSNADSKLSRFLLVPKRKVLRIYNGISDSIIRPTVAQKLVMVARVSRPKDFMTLVRAIKGINIELLIVGKGTDQSNFKSRCKQINPDSYKNIKFYGEHKSPRSLLKKGDIFILSSRYEGLPLSIIEAMCAGMLIIASDCGGVNELIKHNVNGYLFSPGNHLQLHNLIKLSLETKQKSEALSLRARADYINTFTEKKFLINTQRVYERFLK